MKKNILICSYDMEIGGVERSLASMLDAFDYSQYNVDLMLYRHSGEFMGLLTNRANLLREIPQYATFRQSIKETIRGGHYAIGLSRIGSKFHAEVMGRLRGIQEPGYYQLQYMWKYALPFLPKMDQEYDIAISYLWPHYFAADKVKANMKLAWIHTDYSTVETHRAMDLRMWNKFDHIIAVSDACKDAFLRKYPELRSKVTVIENITSSIFIQNMADEEVWNPMKLDSRFKLLTVARLSYAKGIDNAVKAMKLLLDRGYNDIVWYVVGYGGDEAMLRTLIANYGLTEHFILLGKQTNPYPYIKECDLYVQPSRYEGKAVTVTEAKVIGKPVLITNYATARGQVADGVDGMIAELSVEGIAAGIERLYLNPELRQQLADNCLKVDHTNSYELDKIYGLTMSGG